MISSVESTSQYVSLASNHEYVLQSVGFEVGSSFCNKMFMFENPTYGFVELVLNSGNAVIMGAHFPQMNMSASGANTGWSGYEATANPNNLVTAIDNAQVDFTVPTNSTPSQNKNGNCCSVSEWVGLGDRQTASDGALIQGGVGIGDSPYDTYSSGGTRYYSPMFWYEGLGSINLTPWSSTCLNINYGDAVNVTLSKGTYGGGQYNIQFVYGDNDSGSTCAIYWYMSYSISPTWAYYMLEATSTSTCTYNYNYLLGYGQCQIIQFSTIPYTAEMNIGFGWFGAFANTNNYNYYADWINQGFQNTAVSTNSGTAFTQTWDSSYQS